jgi:hypothetical protein
VSDTELMVALPIQYSAEPGPRTVIVTMGSDSLRLPDAFTITPHLRPQLISVNPARARQGDREVTIQFSARNSNWSQGVTRAEIIPMLSVEEANRPERPPGITVLSTTVHSPTRASALISVDPNARTGAYAFQVYDAVLHDGITVANGFTVDASDVTAPSAATTTPPMTAVPLSPALVTAQLPPPIKVVAPNGGENWASGQERYVGWSHRLGDQQQFDVDISLDGGARWENFFRGTPQPVPTLGAGVVGVQLITPKRLLSTALIRVRAAGSSEPSDVSDATFNLVPPTIHILRPTVTDRWVIGTSSTRADMVTLSHNLWPEGRFLVDLTRDGGATWWTIGEIRPNARFGWTVIGPATTRARIRLRPYHELSGVTPSPYTDVSAESPTFTIAPP